MRHGKKFNHLSRKSSVRKALLMNLAISLVEHKRIETTIAKAKALQRYVEPLITKTKEDTTHNRRTVFAYLRDKNTVTELFRNVAPKVATRPGGYTRIIKLGFRQGDGAEMAMIELVDFNELLLNEPTKKTTRRSRRGTTKKVAETTENTETVAPVADAAEPKVENTDSEDSSAESSDEEKK
ncbi:MAG: 50S ribosomal protein L17 [Luteibaculaceae bacterium]